MRFNDFICLVRIVFCLLACTLCGGVQPAAADVIVFKSGRQVDAVNVEQRGDKLTYETEDGSFTIPMRLVERVERADYVPRPPGGGELVAGLAGLSDAELSGVVRNGKIDRALLGQLEAEANRERSESARLRAAAGHALVAQHLAGQHEFEAAADSFRRALVFAPNHPVLLVNLATLEVNQQRYTAALEHLRPVLSQQQFAFEAYRLQGWIFYHTEKMEQAIASWKRALEIRADKELEQLLRKTQEEAQLVRDYQQRESGRFVLRYSGEVAGSPRLAPAILATLERHYDSYAGEFNIVLREPIVVLLYPDEAFRHVTGLPPMFDGVYDGKIRVPVEGLTSLTSRLEEVLRHELVHAFVFYKSGGRAQRWVQEGLAQVMAGERSGVSPQTLRPLFEAGNGSGVGWLEAGFGGSAEEVRVAYAASQVVVDALMRRFGRGDMTEFLEALASGNSTPDALRRTYGLTYADLDRLVSESLR